MLFSAFTSDSELLQSITYGFLQGVGRGTDGDSLEVLTRP